MHISKKQNKILVTLTAILLSINLLIPAAKAIGEEIVVYETTTTAANFNEEVQCLAENIYYESASESFEGKLAVAQVTINRANSGKFPSSICGVVNQKNNINGNLVCQFSWVCNSLKGMIRNKYQWEESMLVARKSLTQPVAHDFLKNQNALYYHNNQVQPGWNLNRVGQIGNHIFYREKNGKI
jgi:spore germination cell wall hydrolase CwlJ-like protein